MATPETPGIPGRPKFAVESIYKDMSEDALAELQDYLSNVNPLTLPLQQIRGFAVQTGQLKEVATTEGTTSTTYTDLATAGPEIVGLRAGLYLIAWGALLNTANSAAGAFAQCGLSVNGAAPATSDFIQAGSGNSTMEISGSKMTLKTLTGESSSLKLVYRGILPSGQAVFGHRWLVALRTANA